jgi:hypothetical protein
VLGIPVPASLLLFRRFGFPFSALAGSGGGEAGGSLLVVLLLPFSALAGSGSGEAGSSLCVVLLLPLEALASSGGSTAGASFLGAYLLALSPRLLSALRASSLLLLIGLEKAAKLRVRERACW